MIKCVLLTPLTLCREWKLLTMKTITKVRLERCYNPKYVSISGSVIRNRELRVPLFSRLLGDKPPIPEVCKKVWLNSESTEPF